MNSATRPTEVLRLRYDLALSLVHGEGAYLVSERFVVCLSAEVAVAVVQRLDGSHTRQQIARDLAPMFDSEQVHAFLDDMVSSGYVVAERRDSHFLVDDAGLYEMAGVARETAEARLANAFVAVHGIGDVTCELVIEQLKAGGVGTILRPPKFEVGLEKATLSLVLTDDYLRPELRNISGSALAARAPWMLAKPNGSIVWTGPTFRHGSTGCWACLAHRLAANRHSYVRTSETGEESIVGVPIGLSSVRHKVASIIGASLASLEVLKVLTAATPDEDATISTLDLLTGVSARHWLTRRPQCPECGDPGLLSERAMEPVVFSSRPKAIVSDGGHRASAPEDFIARFARQVSSITGVVSSVTPVPVPDPSLHVFAAGHNVSRQPNTARALLRGLRAISCGKGMSETQARASAIGEAIERASGVFQGDELRRRSSFSTFGDAAIHPNACMLFSERQYANRQFWNLGDTGFRMVFDPLEDEEIVDWSPVWSVTGECVRWLPTQYLYYGYAREGGRVVAQADSNGCAAGSSLEDAALQAFCELIERDSASIWWYNRVGRPAVNLDSFNQPYVDRLREIYAGLGRDIWALDLTTDFGIPAIGAFSRSIDTEREDILVAFGAHLDPTVALLRALTEMNQFLPAVSFGPNGDPLSRFPDEAFALWCRTATVSNQPYLLPDPGLQLRSANSWAVHASGDLATDLDYCFAQATARGLEVLVLDQTRPDVGMPVIKVLVPGLRHFWPRFAPGRLFDVPVALGWSEKWPEEDGLNPIPIFI